MKTADRPFEGVFGNTVELRMMERLIASPRAEFNITELASMCSMHRDSASKVIEKFVTWNILVQTAKRGNMDLFRLNENEPLVEAINAFNDSLLIQMFPEVEEAFEEIEGNIDIGKSVISTKGPFISTTVENGIECPISSGMQNGVPVPTRAW